jgi:hypothetical protein
MGLAALSLSLFLFAQDQPAPPPEAQEEAQAPAAPEAQVPAAPSPKPSAEEGPAKNLQATFYLGTVVKIDMEKNILELTVTGEDGTPETKRLTLDPKVRLFNRGSGLVLKDLKAGTPVRVLYNIAKEGGLPVAKRIVVKPPDIPNVQTKPRGTGN